MVTRTDTLASPGHPSLLRGTPVVPGVAHGPALIVRGEVSPDAIARFGSGDFADEDAALAAYDTSVAAVVDGFTRRAEAVSGAAAEVLTASAGLARDKGLRVAVRKHLRSGEDLVEAIDAAVDQFASVFTQMGGLMAERVTDLKDIQRRVVANLVGSPSRGCPHRPSRPSWWPRTSLPRTPRASTPPSSSAWSPSGEAPPVTPRSSPASSASPAWSAPPVP